MAFDQTPEEYRQYQDQGYLGTGVFLQLPEGGGTRVTFRPKLTYSQCRIFGLDFQAFKWIPEPIASYAEVQSDLCPTSGEECLKSCAAKGCLCNRASSKCADASGNAPGSTGSDSSDSGNEAKALEEREKIKKEKFRRKNREVPSPVGARG